MASAIALLRPGAHAALVSVLKPPSVVFPASVLCESRACVQKLPSRCSRKGAISVLARSDVGADVYSLSGRYAAPATTCYMHCEKVTTTAPVALMNSAMGGHTHSGQCSLSGALNSGFGLPLTSVAP